MNLIRYIGGQFGRPTGLGGVLSTWVMNRTNRRQYQAVIAMLGMEAGDKVLDIGFGNGFLLSRLHRLCRCAFYGIDISDDMLTLAQSRHRAAVLRGDMHLRTGDVSHLEFPDAFFDRVYTVNTVYFWSDLDRGLSEIARVLRPEGKFVNAFYTKAFLNHLRYTDYGFEKYTLQQLEQAAVRNGFAVRQTNEIRPGVCYCMVMQKPQS